MKKLILLSFLVQNCLTLYAQIGGKATYQFLNLQPSARIAALGGNAIANPDADIQFSFQNPALISDTLNKNLSLSYVNYLSDIQVGNALYGFSIPKIGVIVAGLQFISYGDFEFNDATGNNLGSFSAGEQAFSLSFARPIDERFSWGATTKFINSSLAGLNSTGLATDLGISYADTANRLQIALVMRNFGTQLRTYRPDNNEPLPFDLQFGLSQRLKHLPFRYGLIFHHLHKWDIRYDDPNDEYYKERLLDINGIATNENKKPFGDILLRHIIFQGELLLSKNFNIQVAYNHLRRSELGIPNRNGLGGFSWGFGLRISKFQLSYGSAAFGLVGATNHFTIATNLGAF